MALATMARKISVKTFLFLSTRFSNCRFCIPSMFPAARYFEKFFRSSSSELGSSRLALINSFKLDFNSEASLYSTKSSGDLAKSLFVMAADFVSVFSSAISGTCPRLGCSTEVLSFDPIRNFSSSPGF